MNIETIVLYAFITIFALGMLIVSLLSYRRFKNMQLLFVSIAFLVFFIKGLTQSLSLFIGEINVITTSIYLGLFDLVILIMLFVATLKR